MKKKERLALKQTTTLRKNDVYGNCTEEDPESVCFIKLNRNPVFVNRDDVEPLQPCSRACVTYVAGTCWVACCLDILIRNPSLFNETKGEIKQWLQAILTIDAHEVRGGHTVYAIKNMPRDLRKKIVKRFPRVYFRQRTTRQGQATRQGEFVGRGGSPHALLFDILCLGKVAFTYREVKVIERLSFRPNKRPEWNAEYADKFWFCLYYFPKFSKRMSEFESYLQERIKKNKLPRVVGGFLTFHGHVVSFSICPDTKGTPIILLQHDGICYTLDDFDHKGSNHNEVKDEAIEDLLLVQVVQVLS